MGQQQLLLLVLSTVIVGMATVAGIEAFSQSQRQAAIDQMTLKALEIAIEVQTYTRRPPHMRPGNSTAEDDGLGGDDYVDEVAQYSLNGHNSLPSGYNEDACPDNDPVNTVNAYSKEHEVSVCGHRRDGRGRFGGGGGEIWH